jgi:hypothetical protein
MTENAIAAPAPGESAESAPAPQPGAEQPDGLKEQAGATPEGEQAPEPKAEDGKPGTPKGVQKRLDELTRQRGEAQRMNERLLDVLERTLTQGKPPQIEVPSGPPKREQFETYEAYLEARADFRIAEEVKKLEVKAADAREREAAATRANDWQSKMEKAAEKFEDFADVVFADNLPVTQAMLVAMQGTEIGPEIAYHLGKNPQDAKRISQLPVAAQVREIGKIEARLEAKSAAPVKQPSKAPAPIETVGGGRSGVNGSTESMSQAEYEAMRAKQGAWWGRK